MAVASTHLWTSRLVGMDPRYVHPGSLAEDRRVVILFESEQCLATALASLARHGWDGEILRRKPLRRGARRR